MECKKREANKPAGQPQGQYRPQSVLSPDVHPQLVLCQEIGRQSQRNECQHEQQPDGDVVHDVGERAVERFQQIGHRLKEAARDHRCNKEIDQVEHEIP